MTTQKDASELQAAVDAIEAELHAAELREAIAKTAHTKARQEAGGLRQQLHFASLRLKKERDREAKADALRKRMRDESLTDAERNAAETAYYRTLEDE